MKVGVLTFHRAINYGAALQAYALVRKMNELGFEAELADYRNPHIEKSFHEFSVSKVNSPKKAASFFLNYGRMKRKKRAFKSFMNLVPTGKLCGDAKALNAEEYDVFVTGSDQVWNPDCTGFDKTFFLDFAESDKKAAYAASFGVASLDEKYSSEAGKLIKDYKYIGVRENQGANIVKEIAGREATVVLDPTLLLEGECWKKLAKPSGYGKRKYLLVYMLLNSPSLLDFAEKKAKEQNLEIVCIGNGRRKNITYANDIGPAGFLDLFERAECIVTNSFHGTAFSINLNKEFYVELHNVKNSRNSRMEDVLSLFGLKDRIISEEKQSFGNIEFDYVNKILKAEREKSVAFLESIGKKDVL